MDKESILDMIEKQHINNQIVSNSNKFKISSIKPDSYTSKVLKEMCLDLSNTSANYDVQLYRALKFIIINNKYEDFDVFIKVEDLNDKQYNIQEEDSDEQKEN